MVIEKAAGIRFELPDSFSVEDMHAISFVYHAIVERSFVHFFDSASVFLSASDLGRSQIMDLTAPTITLEDQSVAKTVLGQRIVLGRQRVELQDASIERLDEVRSLP